MNNCGTCEYLGGYGDCHRAPPIAFEEQCSPPRAIFPKVNTDIDWCGEYRARVITKVETKKKDSK